MRSEWKAFGLQLVLGAFVICVVGAPVYAGPIYSFTNITDNSATNAAIGEEQLFVEVEDWGGAQVGFKFTNEGPEACSITDVYFDDGVLFSIADIVGSAGVSFSQFADPSNLPGWNNAIPPFMTTPGFSADSDTPVAANGVNPDEELTVVFNLQPGETYAHVLEGLGSGDLRIGIHVQAFANGGSESFINNGPLIPAPGAVLLSGIGVVTVGWLRRRRSL